MFDTWVPDLPRLPGFSISLTLEHARPSRPTAASENTSGGCSRYCEWKGRMRVRASDVIFHQHRDRP